MQKEIKLKVIKSYDRFATYAERQKDLENGVIDAIIASKEDKTKLLGIKF